MAYTRLEPPKVEFIQEFVTESPTISTPLLAPCIVGPCNAVVNATDSSGNANSDAKAILPAILTAGTAGAYTGLGGKKFRIKYKEYTPVEVTFNASPANPTAAQAAGQVNATTGLTGVAARAATQGSDTYLELYTTSTGTDEYFTVLAGTSDDALGTLGYAEPGFTAYGMSLYNNYGYTIPHRFFPDPDGLLEDGDVDITESSVRAFVMDGSSLQEAKTDESILRRDLNVNMTGTVDLSGLSFPDDVMDLTLELTLYGESEKTATLGATQRTIIIGMVNDLFSKYGTHIANAGVHALADITNTLTTTSLSDDATLTEVGNALNAFQAAHDNHVGDNGGAYHGGAGINTIGALTVTTWANIVTSLNTCKDTFADHIENTAAGCHGSADTANSPTYLAIYAYNQFATCYARHIGNTPGRTDYHTADDTTNTLTASSLSYSATFATVQSGWDDFKAKYNAHDSDGTVHLVGGGSHQIAAAAVTTFDTLETMITEFVTDLAAHLGDGTEHVVADTDNTSYLDQVTKDVNALTENYIINEINAVWSQLASLTAGTNYLYLDTDNGGITVGDGTANSVIGLTDDDKEFVLEVVDDSDSDSTSPYVRIFGANVSSTGAVASVTGTVDITALTYPTDVENKVLAVSDSGGFMQEITFDNTVTSSAELLSFINNIMGAGFATNSANKLKLTTTAKGHEAVIKLGTPNSSVSAHDTILGRCVYDPAFGDLYEGNSTYGTPYPVSAGDELWANDAKVGTIVEVAPGGNTDRVRLDTELALTTTKSNAYIVAKNLTGSSSTRPTPDLTVNTYNALVKHDLLRSHRGDPENTSGALYISYKGLRLDVTPSATNPSLVVVEDTDELEDTLGEATTDNPLALGMYFALTNGPNITVSGLGVDEISADYPQGTYTAYSDCLSLLEAVDVYGLAPLTHEDSVHQAFSTHCTSMSDAGRERICFINPSFPNRAYAQTAASGTDGESTGVANEFDTKVSGLSAALMALDVDPTGGLTADDGVYLDLGSDASNYSISAVSGSTVTLRTSFGYGENEDSFYTTSSISTSLLQQTFSVRVRGAAITAKLDQAKAYADKGNSYASRRTYMVVPDNVTASVDGISQNIGGYYMCSAICGQVGQQDPDQGFSNLPISGFTGLNYSSGYFSDDQLNVIAGGGGYIIQQLSDGGPLSCRHQVSTDVTTVKKRELSVNKTVDFSIKFLRLSVRSMAGRYNIDDSFMDVVSTVLSGSLEWLTEEAGVLLGASIDNIKQSTSRSDGVEAEIDFEVGIPGNHIKVTVLI